jgi:hypothetical protein
MICKVVQKPFLFLEKWGRKWRYYQSRNPHVAHVQRAGLPRATRDSYTRRWHVWQENGIVAYQTLECCKYISSSLWVFGVGRSSNKLEVKNPRNGAHFRPFTNEAFGTVDGWRNYSEIGSRNGHRIVNSYWEMVKLEMILKKWWK